LIRGLPLLLTALCAGVTLAAQKPNILVILADDLGNGDLSCCGAKDIRTPNLDSLAAQGMRFTRFYANSCVCSPTRAALLTGRFPEFAGVPGVIRTPGNAGGSWGRLAPDAVLLPKALKPAGYHSAIVGKWHLGLTAPDSPNERGFDLFHGFLGDMMDDYLTHIRDGKNYMRHNADEITPEGHATDLFTAWACEYLESRRGKDEPFFLYLAYNAPHSPIQPPPDWLKKVKDRDPAIPEKRAKLAALIEHLDAGIGRVLETLKTAGLEENTLVIFTSDNGGDLNCAATSGPLRDGKGSMYEGGLRVPCFARWPGKIAAGSTTDRIALTMDIFPTVIEPTGIERKAQIEGVSFLGTLLGRATPAPERDLFFIRREGGKAFGGQTSHSLRRGDWKLVLNRPTAKLELFNLQDDPLETRDLASTEKKTFDELAAALRAQMQRGEAVPWQPAK
jgi:arylsulfatase A-like enzyme